MHGCIHSKRLVFVLAAIIVAASAGLAWAQVAESAYPLAADPAYAISAQPVASNFNAPKGQGLEGRVAELEAALAKMKSKEADAKKKAEGKPSVQAGGRIQWDWMANTQDAIGFAQQNQPDGTEFRRARIFIKGGAFHVVDYKIQMDFADTAKGDGGSTIQSTAFKDVYITIKELPLIGHVRAGHFKEPFGLEQLTSARFITFMERSTSDENMFVPARNTGVMIFDHTENERATWAVGGFVSKESSEPPVYKSDNRGGLAFTGRATWLPWYDEATEGRGLIHLGLSYTYRDMDDNTQRFRMRPESHIADYVIDFTLNDVPSWQVLDFETALVYGPFSVQAEFFNTFIRRTANPDPTLQGMYVYFSYFLTGEHRTYKRSGGVFDRVTPYENFFRVRAEDGCVYTGKGAWELAYRFSYLDTNRGGIDGGILADHTIGVNWYLNPYTRLMWNYVNSGLTNGLGRGYTDLFQMRCQIDF